MSLPLPVLTAGVGVAFAACAFWALDPASLPTELYACHCRRFEVRVLRLGALRHPRRWFALGLALSGAAAFVGLVARAPLALLSPFVLVAVVVLGLRRLERSRRLLLEQQLDRFLLALADALATTPNLTQALTLVYCSLDEPMRSEIADVLARVRLGRPVDEALGVLGRRAGLPGLDAAISALHLGGRMGGNLPSVLRGIAASLREMARLEGVVRAKTAEGRTQAWVMGAVPVALMGLLQWIDPEWLAPLWLDPIGWLLLGLAAVFELAAILLIRRILAVTL